MVTAVRKIIALPPELARQLEALADDSDSRILECAQTGDADAVLTGDGATHELGLFRGIRLISLRGYLAIE